PSRGAGTTSWPPWTRSSPLPSRGPSRCRTRCARSSKPPTRSWPCPEPGPQGPIRRRRRPAGATGAEGRRTILAVGAPRPAPNLAHYLGCIREVYPDLPVRRARLVTGVGHHYDLGFTALT